ncbi:hypothetical protein COOONC_08155 [Cooperia oncophora]
MDLTNHFPEVPVVVRAALNNLAHGLTSLTKPPDYGKTQATINKNRNYSAKAGNECANPGEPSLNLPLTLLGSLVTAKKDGASLALHKETHGPLDTTVKQGIPAKYSYWIGNRAARLTPIQNHQSLFLPHRYKKCIEHTFKYAEMIMKSGVREYIASCVKCRRFNAQPYYYPETKDLQQLLIRCRSFQNIDLDFF